MVFLVVASGLVVSAMAQEEDIEEPEPVIISQMTVIGSKEAALDLPASGNYIDLEELRKYDFTDVNRALRQSTGVYVREEDGAGLFPNISIRGVTTERSRAVTVMEDGILSAPAPYSSPSAYYIPNVARMSGLEILKGSSQIKYGPHITGGAINYLSTPIPGANESFLKLSYGSFNEVVGHVWSGDAFDLEKNGRFGYLVEGFVHRSDGFKTVDAAPGFRETDDTGFNRFEPMVKAFWEPATPTYQRVEWKYGFTSLEADETYLGLTDEDFDRDPFRRYAASRFDHIETENHRGNIRYIIEPSDALRLETVAYAQYFERNWSKLHQLRGPNVGLSAALVDLTPGGGLDILRGAAAGTLRVRNNAREYTIYGVQSTANGTLDVGPTEHRWEFGARFHFDEVDRFQWNVDYDQAADGSIVGSAVGLRGAAGDRVQQSRAFAAHVKDEILWGPWSVTPGIRFETISQDYEQDQRRADGGGSPAEGDGRLNALAGGMSVGYEISADWKAFFGVHRGFSVPGPRASIRNDLDEETSLSYELGTRYSRPEIGLLAEAVLFHTDFSDLIVGGNLAAGAAAVTENVGDVRSRGLELSLQYDHGQTQGWALRTPARLALTLTDATLQGDATNTDPESIFEGGRDGARAPYVPRYLINGEIGVENDRAGAFLSLTYVPGTFTSASNREDGLRTDGAGGLVPDARVGRSDPYFLADLTMQYEWRPGLVLNLGVRNLFDRQYVASRHPHGARPGMPRSFVGGFEWTF